MNTSTTDPVWGISTRRLRWRLGIDRWIGYLLPLLLVIILFPLFNLLYWIFVHALPTFTWSILATNPVGLGGGLLAPLTGTFYLLGLATAVSAVIGVIAGMYTAEFASPMVASISRMGGNLLAGVPAIVIGYFGYFALVLYTGWGTTLFAGGITLSIFMLPYIYRISDLAFQSVPVEQKEGAIGMGATRGQYLRRVAWPIAFPRILTGIFVAMAIGIGETAPLLFTAGWNVVPAQGLFDKGGTSYLTGLIWLYYNEPAGFGTEQTLAFQAAFLLIVIVIALNVIVQLIAERYRRRLRGLYR